MTKMEEQAREFLAITRTGTPDDTERFQIYMLAFMAGMKFKELSAAGGKSSKEKEGAA